GYILIVPGSSVPPVQAIRIGSKTWPTEMLPREQFRFDSRRSNARSKCDMLVVRARHYCPSAKGQRWQRRKFPVGFITNLITHAEAPIHQASSGMDPFIRIE